MIFKINTQHHQKISTASFLFLFCFSLLVLTTRSYGRYGTPDLTKRSLIITIFYWIHHINCRRQRRSIPQQTCPNGPARFRSPRNDRSFRHAPLCGRIQSQGGDGKRMPTSLVDTSCVGKCKKQGRLRNVGLV
jgi:hypothetical protein